MARYLAYCKVQRRLGTDLGLSRVREVASKCKLATPPGIHGARVGVQPIMVCALREAEIQIRMVC